MRTLFWTAAGAAITMLGCGGGSRTQALQESQPSAGCVDLAGKSFTAVQRGECGMGTDGKVVQCFWRIHFFFPSAQGPLNFEWYHSDYTQRGPVLCNDGALTSTPQERTPSYHGTYDPGSRTLQWEGVEYRHQP